MDEFVSDLLRQSEQIERANARPDQVDVQYDRAVKALVRDAVVNVMDVVRPAPTRE